MEKIPAALRFKRFSPFFFDEEARARLCESSGSEHSATAEAEESSGDLSELVDSFLEEDCGVEEEEFCRNGERQLDERRSRSDHLSESDDVEFERKQMLLSLIRGEAGGDGDEDEDGDMRRMIGVEIESAWRSLSLGSGSAEGVKRRVMSWLRHKGFDSGLCKSRWEKTANSPAGKHEYIDIITAGSTRYIVEISPASQFTIARPTSHYASLLQLFPRILVSKEDNLKKVVRLMCAATWQSLKEREMHVPPWRRKAYVQAKWFGPYKRTTNPVPAAKVADCGRGSAEKSLLGFEMVAAAKNQVCCRGEMVRKGGFGRRVVGNLNADLNGMHL